MYRLCILFIFAAVFGTAAASAQEESGLVMMAKGILVVWNEPGNHYTLQVRGERIEPTPGRLWFKVDGKFFQIATVPKKQFEKPGATDDKSVLTAHMAWEADYIGGLLKAKVAPVSAAVKLPNGLEALAWSFDMPKVAESQTARRQLYIAIVKRDHVMLLNSPVEGTEDEKPIAKYLADTLATLKSSDKPLPLAAASEMVRKEDL